MNECPICLSHWDMVVEFGQRHHEFCPAEGFIGTVREPVGPEVEIGELIAEVNGCWEAQG